MKEQDSIKLIDKVISNQNLWNAYEKVRKNKGAPGIDGITVDELKEHMQKHFEPLKMAPISHNPLKEFRFRKQMGLKDILVYLVC